MAKKTPAKTSPKVLPTRVRPTKLNKSAIEFDVVANAIPKRVIRLQGKLIGRRRPPADLVVTDEDLAGVSCDAAQ